THSAGLRYRSLIFLVSKKSVRPTLLYATCASSPMTSISYRFDSASSLIIFSLKRKLLVFFPPRFVRANLHESHGNHTQSHYNYPFPPFGLLRCCLQFSLHSFAC